MQKPGSWLGSAARYIIGSEAPVVATQWQTQGNILDALKYYNDQSYEFSLMLKESSYVHSGVIAGCFGIQQLVQQGKASQKLLWQCVESVLTHYQAFHNHYASSRWYYLKQLHGISYYGGKGQLPIYVIQDGDIVAIQWKTFRYSTGNETEGLQQISRPLQFKITPESG